MANKSKNNYLMVAADVIIAAFGITTLFPAATMTTAYAQKANNNNIPAGCPEGTTSFEHEMCIMPPNLLCDETLGFVMD